MKIKVWGANAICESLEESKYYNGNRQEIKVRGLKTKEQIVKEQREKAAEKLSDPVEKACMIETGMTPSEYQKAHNRAWNE